MIATGQKGSTFEKIPDAPVILWDFDNSKPIFKLTGLQVNVKYLSFSPDDQFLAAYGIIYLIHLYRRK